MLGNELSARKGTRLPAVGISMDLAMRAIPNIDNDLQSRSKARQGSRQLRDTAPSRHSLVPLPCAWTPCPGGDQPMTWWTFRQSAFGAGPSPVTSSDWRAACMGMPPNAGDKTRAHFVPPFPRKKHFRAVYIHVGPGCMHKCRPRWWLTEGQCQT